MREEREVRKTILLLGMASLALASCKGEAPAADGAATAEAAKAGKQASGLPGDWNATDACTIIDRAEMGEIMKAEVKSTQLDLVHQPSGTDAATSQCSYKFAEGLDATLMTRWSPIKDNTPEAIAAAKSASQAALKTFSDRKIEDIPGLGKGAFFVPGINQLDVFIDDARMITLSIPSASDSEAKDLAIALAKKAGA